MRHPLRGNLRRKVRSSFNKLTKIDDKTSLSGDDNEISAPDSSVTQESNIMDLHQMDFKKNNKDRKRLVENYKMSRSKVNKLQEPNKISKSQDLKQQQVHHHRQLGCRSPEPSYNWGNDLWTNKTKHFFQNSSKMFRSKDTFEKIDLISQKYGLPENKPVLIPKKKITTKDLLSTSHHKTQIDLLKGAGVKFEPLDQDGTFQMYGKTKLRNVMQNLGKNLY